jgi:chromosome partitioning protein
MNIPVLTFFSNKGGVGRTSLVYHLAWMFSTMGKRVVAIDLDPQANLTSAFLPENQLEILWDRDNPAGAADTIYQCVRPLLEGTGELSAPSTRQINSCLFLLPGDLGLASFEDSLSQEWPYSLGSGTLYRPFRILTAFWQVAQLAAKQHQAHIILADVGPNLGAINRSALISSDHVVIPVAADLFSLQCLRNLGPTLRAWRSDWGKRVANWSTPAFDLPAGSMEPVGYIIQQHTERFSRPIKAYVKWAARIPSVYRSSVLGVPGGNIAPESDEQCLAQIKHYGSLVPMAQEARKPIFQLTAADGAIGSHSYAVAEALYQFNSLAKTILGRIAVPVV